MTREDFKEFEFTAGQRFMYKGVPYQVITVDFIEDLIGLADEHPEGEPLWVRCESVEYYDTLRIGYEEVNKMLGSQEVKYDWGV